MRPVHDICLHGHITSALIAKEEEKKGTSNNTGTAGHNFRCPVPRRGVLH